jgi:heat shock protein HslJ
MRFPRARQFLSVAVAALWLTNFAFVPSSQAATEGLSGTTWRLVQFRDDSGQVLAADKGSSYTLEFRTDDTVAVRVDCHRGRGTWVSRSASQLELGPLALTRAACPQTPLHVQIAKQWTSIRSYALRDAHLFLLLGANAGTYEFEPADAVTSQPTAAAPAATPPAGAPDTRSSWLDESRPASWTVPGAPIPRAPQGIGTVDPRCRAQARPPESEADKRLAERGWDLIGAYQVGWGVLVLEGTASYDGMCRPQAYQEFVFVRGVFAGTLAPATMDSRADGSLNRVTLQGDGRLTAEYARYARSDALCCPSRTTSVVFEIAADQSVVRPRSASTFANR